MTAKDKLSRIWFFSWEYSDAIIKEKDGDLDGYVNHGYEQCLYRAFNSNK